MNDRLQAPRSGLQAARFGRVRLAPAPASVLLVNASAARGVRRSASRRQSRRRRRHDRSPLGRAGGDLETAKRLLAAGAGASAANRYGVTPLSLAASQRRRRGRAVAARRRRRPEHDLRRRRDGADDGRAHRACGGRASAHRPRRQRQRRRGLDGRDRRDVGGGRRPCGDGEAAGRGRRRARRARGPSGVPQDHLQRQHDGFDTAAARRHDSAAAGRARGLGCGCAGARGGRGRPERARSGRNDAAHHGDPQSPQRRGCVADREGGPTRGRRFGRHDGALRGRGPAAAGPAYQPADAEGRQARPTT